LQIAGEAMSLMLNVCTKCGALCLKFLGFLSKLYVGSLEVIDSLDDLLMLRF